MSQTNFTSTTSWSTTYGAVSQYTWEWLAQHYPVPSRGRAGSHQNKEGTVNMTEIKTAEVHPVVPKAGALIRVKESGTLLNFIEWKRGGLALADGKTYRLDDVEALTPAHYGLLHKRATAMPASGYSGSLLEVRQWRGLNPVIILEGETRSQSWGANTVAALAPVLDPAKETNAAKMARIEREHEALVQGLHARMVAEGEARSWCAEFDGILDATGLPPRVVKNVVVGTMTFRSTINGAATEEMLEQIKRRPWDYVPTRDCTITEVKAAEQPVGPLLS